MNGEGNRDAKLAAAIAHSTNIQSNYMIYVSETLHLSGYLLE